jgi:hypothetical protein
MMIDDRDSMDDIDESQPNPHGFFSDLKTSVKFKLK